jgi:TRAP-type C4-dicarboxylate transport system substrate-binding protein
MMWKSLDKATAWQWEQAGKDDSDAFNELKAKGMSINTLTSAQAKLFQEKTDSIYKESEKGIGKAWIDKFVQANK